MFWFLALSAHAAEPCVGVTDIASKSRQSFQMKVLMPHLLVLQGQGEAKFHPTVDPPRSQCAFETFTVGDATVDALYTPRDEYAVAALVWQFDARGPDPRTIHVLHDATTAAVVRKDVFFVVEERRGQISHYAVYVEQPAYAALKPLVTGILDGSARPLTVVHWPPGAPEPVLDAPDPRMKW